MCPLVGPPPLGSSFGELPSHVEYLPPQKVLLPPSTVQPHHPCGLSCEVPLLGRRPPPGCVPAQLLLVASMAPGDICHGPRCCLARLRPLALAHLLCRWRSGLARSPGKKKCFSNALGYTLVVLEVL